MKIGYVSTMMDACILLTSALAPAAVDARNKALETERLRQAKTLMTQANNEIATRRGTLQNMAYPAKRFNMPRSAAIAGAAKAGALKGAAPKGAGGAAGGSPSGSAVYLIDPSGKEHTLSVSSWSNTHIVARTPALTGFASPQNCKIYVKNKVGKSDQKPLVLQPSLTTTLLLMQEVLVSGANAFKARGPQDAFGLMPSPAAAIWLNGYHRAGTFEGHKDDDEYFLKRKLRNGWVVDSVDVTPQNARLEVSRVGTDSPYLKIHWWCDAPWQTVSYTVQIVVKGPKGTMY